MTWGREGLYKSDTKCGYTKLTKFYLTIDTIRKMKTKQNKKKKNKNRSQAKRWYSQCTNLQRLAIQNL